ncbi:MAG TPA: hypothetical protein VLC08_11365 [Chitinolyticbacter sp.]|nr:hypothetical protein [Chitinolyticbacter sp.]
MQVTFDSNAWENILIEQDVLHPLRVEIEKGSIQPYVCQIALSLESIERKNRKDFFESYQPKIEIHDFPGGKGVIHNRLSFCSDNDAHPGLHDKLKKKLDIAKSLGFKILPMTNIGTVRSPEIDKSMLGDFDTVEEFWDYAERLSECSRFIEGLGCGYAHYDATKKSFGSPEFAPSNIEKKLSESIAEWVDGEILAAHYASQNAVFCTEDRAGNAGAKSIMSPSNFAEFTKRFPICVVNIEGLLNILRAT